MVNRILHKISVSKKILGQYAVTSSNTRAQYLLKSRSDSTSRSKMPVNVGMLDDNCTSDTFDGKCRTFRHKLDLSAGANATFVVPDL